MRKYIFLFLPIWFSCSDTKSTKILSEEQMVNILVDIHVAEGQVNGMHLGSVDSSLVVYNYFEKKIFKRHQVDSATFSQNLQDYLREPMAFKNLYQKVRKRVDSKNKKKSPKPE